MNLKTYKQKYRFIAALMLLMTLLVSYSCGIYSFSGLSLSPDVKTVSVANFSNQANQVVPSLAENLTEDLKEKLIRELNLSIVDFDSDIAFQGAITEYKVGPSGITSNEQAGTSRLTMTVKVEYTNYLEPKSDFNATFSNYIDFDSKENFNSIQDDLNEELVEMIIQDIFNRAFNNW